MALTLRIPQPARRLTSGSTFQSLLVFAIKAVAGLSGYLLFALIARKSGVEEFGKFSIFFSAAMMAGTAGSLGQQVFLVKEIARAQHADDAQLETAAYAFSFVATLIGSVASGVLFFVLVTVLYPDQAYSVAVGGGFLAVTYALSQTTLGALRIQNRIVLAVASRDLIWRILTSVVIALLPWLLPALSIDAGVALLSMAVSLLCIIVWHAVAIATRLPSRLSLRGAVYRRWMQLTAGLTFVAVISSADLYIFSIVLGKIVPASEVGPFFAAMKTVEVINLLLMSVALVVGPNIARAIAARDSRLAQIECNAAIVIQGLPAVFACLAVLAFAHQLLGLFDASFSEHVNVLYVLTIGTLVNALAGPTVLMLQLIDLHWRQVALQGGSLIAALALLPMLVHEFGLVGAAYAYVLSKVVWNAAAIISSRLKTGVDPSCFGLFGSGALTFRQSVAELRRALSKALHDQR